MGKPNKEVRKLKKDKSVSHGAYVTLPKLEPEPPKASPEKKPEEDKPKGFEKVNKGAAPKSRKFATSRPKKEPEEPKRKEPVKNPFLHVVITSDEEKGTVKDGVERRPFKVGKQKPKEGDLEDFVSAFPKIPDRLIFDNEKEKPNVFDGKTMRLPSKRIEPSQPSFKAAGSPRSVPLGALRPTGSQQAPSAPAPLRPSALVPSPSATNNLAWPRTPQQQPAPSVGPKPLNRVNANNPRSNRAYTLPTMFPEPLTYATSHISSLPGRSASAGASADRVPLPAGYGQSLSSGYNSMRFNTPPSQMASGPYGPAAASRNGAPYGAYGSPYGYAGPANPYAASRYPASGPYQSPFGRYAHPAYASPYMPYGSYPYAGSYATRYPEPPGPNRAAQGHEEHKPLLDDEAIEESPIFDKPPVSIEEGMKTADQTRSKKRKGLILTMVAMLVVIAVGVGYLAYSGQVDLASMLGIGVPSEQSDGQAGEGSSSSASSSSRSSASSSSAASVSAGSVVYQYTALTADGTTYSVEETVTFAADGTCEFTTMEMEFPDEAAAQAYVASLSNDYGSKLTVDSTDGAKVTVTIDNSSLHLDREEYENTLRYSVQDLVILRK